MTRMTQQAVDNTRAAQHGERGATRAALLLAVVLATAACGAPGGRSGSRAAASTRPAPTPLTKVADIDSEFRGLLVAYGQGGQAWEAVRERVIAAREAGDPRKEQFLIDNLVLEMVRAYQVGALRTVLRDDAPFERAQAEVVRFGAAAVPMLAEMVAAEDGVLAFLGSATLRSIGRPALEPTLLLLDHERAEVRRRAAELLADLPVPPADEATVRARLAQVLQTDGAWIVRAQAVRGFGKRAAAAGRDAPGAAAARDLLERTLLDTDPAVSKEAIDAVGALGDALSKDPLLALWTRLERDHSQNLMGNHRDYLRRRDAIEKALAAITGETQRQSLEAWRRRS